MIKKRTVLLLGAGAVIDWKGPSTCELTKSIRETGFFCIDNETRITEFIYQKLICNGYDKNDINFETIINVIEELIIYYSSFNCDKKTPSLLNVFFKSPFEEYLLNFSVKGGVIKHGFKLEIPKGDEYKSQHIGALNNETPAQYFFQLLLANLLTTINARISKYALHRNDTYTNLNTEDNKDINSLFSKWIKQLNPNENILRTYTLNYDRIFKILSLNSGVIEIFEGFECGKNIELGEKIPANIPRIITDFNCHCHYNLHGSIFWKPEPRDENQLFNTELYLQSNPQLPSNLSEQPFLQIEKGKNILISNIITGYQKAQKGYLAPFKQMQSAFDRDCIEADNLYIIGYSFGDEHINMSIKTALKYNSKIKIYLVDPVYDERNGKNGYELLTETFINHFPQYLNDFTPKNKINDVSYQYYNGKIIVYTIGMKEFLKLQKNNL